MDDKERAHLEQVANRIVKASRSRAVIIGVAAAVAFILLQTAVILVAARLTSEGNQKLVDRVDRNVAFTACVLSFDPDTRTPGDVQRCLDRANERFGDSGTPDDPRLLNLGPLLVP